MVVFAIGLALLQLYEVPPVAVSTIGVFGQMGPEPVMVAVGKALMLIGATAVWVQPLAPVTVTVKVVGVVKGAVVAFAVVLPLLHA